MNTKDVRINTEIPLQGKLEDMRDFFPKEEENTDDYMLNGFWCLQ